MNDENTPVEEPTSEPEPQPIPFPNDFMPAKSNLLMQLERFAEELIALKQSHRIQIGDGISLLSVTLNYNLMARQMGLFGPPQPQVEETDDDEG